MRGDLSQGCPAGARPVARPGALIAPVSDKEFYTLAKPDDDRRMIAPSAPMMLLASGGSSKTDDFR